MTLRETQLAEAANRETKLAGMATQISTRYHGGPHLSDRSTVDEIADWLQWCDPNGCHTRALVAGEDFDFYTLEEAWEALAEMLCGS